MVSDIMRRPKEDKKLPGPLHPPTTTTRMAMSSPARPRGAGRRAGAEEKGETSLTDHIFSFLNSAWIIHQSSHKGGERRDEAETPGAADPSRAHTFHSVDLNVICQKGHMV